MSILSERAMLVRPTISVWQGKVVDRRASNETAERHNADKDTLDTTKRLIAKAALEPINQAARTLRAYAKAETLPWRWEGVGLLPSTNYFEFMEGWRTHQNAFDAAVRSFLGRYGVHVREGQRKLGDLSDYHYPNQAEAALKFHAAAEVFPVPEAQDFRTELPESEAEAIRASLQDAADAELLRAQSYMWEQMQEAVGKIVSKLDGYATGENRDGKIVVLPGSTRIHDTLMGNLQTLVSRLGRLNLTNDPAIETMRLELHHKLAGYDSQSLRDDPKTRDVVKDEASKLLAQLQAGGFIAQQAAE